MRLINTSSLELEAFNDEQDVEYAILSHRWEDGEVSLQDFVASNSKTTRGFTKIKCACSKAQEHGWKYMWIDTCCIDKTSSAELSEAINSMYRWYDSATTCYAYLSDIESLEDLEKSIWFDRGWTLQELIAPKDLRFYNRYWKYVGSKYDLTNRIFRRTKIPERILLGEKPATCSIAARMSWAANRVTTRSEDIAYCLMGLFDVNMPMLYGEGAKAFVRLQEEIVKISDDQSIFAWPQQSQDPVGILATSPRLFESCADLYSTERASEAEPYSMTNAGLSIRLPVIPWAMHTYIATLQCGNAYSYRHNVRTGILIARTSRQKQYVRIGQAYMTNWNVERRSIPILPLLLLQRTEQVRISNYFYGFILERVPSQLLAQSTIRKDQSHRYISRKPLNKEGWFTKGEETFYSRYPVIDEQPETFELAAGERGVVLGIYPNSENLAIGQNEVRKDKLGCIILGFDFDFNPFCVFCDAPSAFEVSKIFSKQTHLHSVSEWIEYNLTKCETTSASINWSERGMHAFRVRDEQGNPQIFKEMNLTIWMRPKRIDGERLAWCVRIVQQPNYILDDVASHLRQLFSDS